MEKPLYLDPGAPIDVRVEDLLQRMTLEEKIAQLQSVWVQDLLDDRGFSEEKASRILRNGIGQITRVSGSRVGLRPREAVAVANEIQRYLVTKTRLKIPAIIHEECLSGFMAPTATSFPQFIGLASAWDPDLVYRVASAIREQMRRVGAHQGLAPVLDVARDPRYGRTEETFGEDPYLVAILGVMYVRGLQGSDLRRGVIATLKHFAGHGFPEGGRNTAPVHATPRMLREVFLYPFEAAVKVGNAYSVMPAYHEIDGVPCHANRWLLTDVLRKEWGFKGFAVSDYAGIERLSTDHRVARDCKEAAALALEAGVDIELPSVKCYGDPLLEAVKEGLVKESVVDEAVRRVLRVKFMLGLFENPFVDPNSVPEELDNPEHRALALEAARKSIVLLKNSGALPLRRDIESIAVIGPSADSGRNLLGDYTYTAHLPSEETVKITAVLEAIKKKVSEKTRVLYAKGCDIAVRSGDFDKAIEIAEKAEAVVLVMGERSGLSNKWLNRWLGKSFEELQHLTGEGNDSHDLRLPSVQEELIMRIAERVKKPVILVLINGRPLDISSIIDRVSAVVEAWFPGEEGGEAIADVLFGDYNPGGKLPISWPRHVGQIPVHYNRKPSSLGDYVFTDSKPLFPFGHGLSYTRFKYDSLEITPGTVDAAGSVRISFTIENIGDYDGDEVPQLYISKEYSSVARPVKELKGFKRVHLKRGERKRVTFVLPTEILAFYDRDMKLAIEPGVYRVMIGSSSEDIRLTGEFRITSRRELVQRDRFFSEAMVEDLK